MLHSRQGIYAALEGGIKARLCQYQTSQVALRCSSQPLPISQPFGPPGAAGPKSCSSAAQLAASSSPANQASPGSWLRPATSMTPSWPGTALAAEPFQLGPGRQRPFSDSIAALQEHALQQRQQTKHPDRAKAMIMHLLSRLRSAAKQQDYHGVLRAFQKTQLSMFKQVNMAHDGCT